MVAFKFEFFSSVLLAVLCASSGIAAPSRVPVSGKHSTHLVRRLASGATLVAYHPEPTYKTFGEGLALEPHLVTQNLEDRTIGFITSQLQVDAVKVGFRSGFNDEGRSYGYVHQSHDNIPFINAVANVAFKDNKAVAFGSSFVKIDKVAGSVPTVPLDVSIIARVEENLGAKKNDIEPTLKYLVLPNGSCALIHSFQVENDDGSVWYEAYVDAHSGELLSATDFVAHASYRVLPAWKLDPTAGLELLADPQDVSASPSGWHDGDGTSGNNVISYKRSMSTLTQESSPGVYDYPYDAAGSASTGANPSASRVQGFYTANTFHDTLYKYGFTENAFNFQTNNFGLGGSGNDRVLMSSQDPSGKNNAYFSTPPDGQSGKAAMFEFTITSPSRDGLFQNDIPNHELTHGLTGRMTGGGIATCLRTSQARGLGEGWSDAVAEWFYHTGTPEFKDFVTGTWVLNNTIGVRNYPYSTSKDVNPLTYASIGQLFDEHDIGEVWANMLHNIYGVLVKAYGYSSTARTNPTGAEGNIVFLRLLVEALALQPCNPTFMNARDAWIQADANRYGGANKCLLWMAFASRGLGVNATADLEDSDDIPEGC